MTVQPYVTAREMLADLEAKRISARELLDAHVARHEALAGKLNAVVATDLEHARAAAKSIDDARAHGAKLGVLAGLPMTIKDGYDVAGMPATSGNPVFAKRKKDCLDADLVACVRKKGAIIWGKTNVPFMLGDFQSYNAIYGTTNNPYDVTRTPGGSSGGAAVALAAGMAPLEIGSDIGGSLRHPANFCGVFSLKPTWGALSLRGHIPPAPDAYMETDLGVGGPLARNAEDLRLLWSVLNERAPVARRGIEGARVAIWDEEAGFPLARDVREGVARAAKALAGQGAHVERAKPKIAGAALLESYLRILTPILAAGFPPSLLQQMEAARASDLAAMAGGASPFGPEGYRLAATARFYEVADAMVKRQAQKDALAAFFGEGWDAILMPITPVTAFPHNHAEPINARIIDVDGESWPYLMCLAWIALATSLHAPAIAVPAGQADGLPVGVQIVGPWDGEDRLIDFGAALEEALGGFSPPPL